MIKTLAIWFTLFLSVHVVQAYGETVQEVMDIPTRPDVTMRALVLTPTAPKATVILFAGGHGGLQIFPNGSFNWGEGNFLVRTRQIFAEHDLTTIVLDAPSDRQRPPFLSGNRQSPEHVADIKAVMAWARGRAGIPVWLVGTSRGTQSVAHAATELDGKDGADGLVLTSTILTDEKSRPVPSMPLAKLTLPVLVVHHEQDGCKHCAFSEVPSLMEGLNNSPRKQLLAFAGGTNLGNPCEARSYHGFNGLERDVVAQIAAWIQAK